MIHVMNFLSDLVGNPEDRFAHDAAHINQRFSCDLHNVSLQWQRLYNTYHICRDIVSFTKTQERYYGVSFSMFRDTE